LRYFGREEVSFGMADSPFVGQNGMYRFALWKKAALPNVGR
jgi:hypothetical protein